MQQGTFFHLRRSPAVKKPISHTETPDQLPLSKNTLAFSRSCNCAQIRVVHSGHGLAIPYSHEIRLGMRAGLFIMGNLVSCSICFSSPSPGYRGRSCKAGQATILMASLRTHHAQKSQSFSPGILTICQSRSYSVACTSSLDWEILGYLKIVRRV